MIGNKKGQGSTEYLVLLAMVLIVAMVAIALLGFFPGLAGDTRATQSASYWSGTARPFAIKDHTLATGATSPITLQIQNLDSDTKQITAIELYGLGVNRTNSSVNTYLTGGQVVSIVARTASGSCTTGSPYEFNVTITYSTVGGLAGAKQIGTKSLIGTCG